jgi:hypothetical protein
VTVSKFRTYLTALGQRQPHYPLGVRATVVPTRASIFIERLYKNPEVVPVYKEFSLTYGDRGYRLLVPSGHMPH